MLMFAHKGTGMRKADAQWPAETQKDWFCRARGLGLRPHARVPHARFLPPFLIETLSIESYSLLI